MNTLKEKLMLEARAKGICAEGYGTMRVDDIDALVDYYIENPDWALERDYPTLAVLKEHFSGMGDKGVFVGRTFHGEVLNDLQAYIFHDCKGTVKVGLNVEKKIIPMLYVANGCRLRFVGVGDYAPRNPDERCIVPLYSFGRNDISARDNKYVMFNRYKKNYYDGTTLYPQYSRRDY